jgi:hypothetical protein
MVLAIQVSALLCFLVGALNAWSYFHQRNGDWHFIDGTEQVRRWTGDGWQYRNANDSEKLLEEQSRQW